MTLAHSETSLRVLYAEDNPQDADLTRSHLLIHAPEFALEIAATGQACLERLHTGHWDVLLLDYRLSDMEGLAVLRALISAGLQIPVVLVTGSGDENLVLQALRLGAANYVPKSGNYLNTLPAVLHDAIKEHQWKREQGSAAMLPVKILYVEDTPRDVELTLRHFADTAPNFVMDIAATSIEALLRLGQTPEYDLMLLDLNLSDQSGLDVVRECQRLGLSLPPFVVLSGKGSDAVVIAALQLGAANYIIKRDGYLKELVYTIDQVIAQIRLNRANQQLHNELSERKQVEAALRENEVQLRLALSELRQREDTILKLATHDELTGLPNRRLFYDRLTMAIADARRNNRNAAVVFIDLDHFKDVNDTLGHQAGDAFLIAIAEQLKTVPREMDTCARMGGDEFALVLSNLESREQVSVVTQRVLDTLNREFIIDGACLIASASLGVAIFPDDAQDTSLLLRCADIAMYRSKGAGRNTCRFWDNDLDATRPASFFANAPVADNKP